MGLCRFCGKEGEGKGFSEWVRDTFTDWDKLLPGEIICNDCLFWVDEANESLTKIVGKWWATELEAITCNPEKVEKWQKENKTTRLPTIKELKVGQFWGGYAIPQRMRNYSHFVVDGKWYPLSKGDKAKMIELLLSEPFPELAAIAESGQKHIAFRATRNPKGSRAGWVQFEEQRLWVNPPRLKSLIDTIETGLVVFSKGEMESGQYLPYRIIDFGLPQWQALETVIKPLRGSLFFKLAIFLSQRKETQINDNGIARDGNRSTRDHLAGDRQRLQKPLPADDLGTAREYGEGIGLHQQSGQVHQLDLFET